VRGGLGGALTGFTRERERGGRDVRGDMTRRAGVVGRIVRRIRARLPIVQRDVARRAQERLARLTAGAGIDPARLAQEVAAVADRGDVTAELGRVGSPLAPPRPAPGRAPPAGGA